MGKLFSVEIRRDCLVCGTKLEPGYRTYCSKKCRTHNLNKRRATYSRTYARKQRAKYAPGKLKCLVCGGWYVQVGSHVMQRHHFTAREYREYYDLPLKRGVIPSWFRELKGNQAIENETYKNLRSGKRYWYKKNDPKAKENRGWKGRRGSIGYEPDDFYN